MDTNSIIQIGLNFISNYPWFGIITSAIALASAITAITPTPKQGSVLSYVYKIIDILAINIGKAKDK